MHRLRRGISLTIFQQCVVAALLSWLLIAQSNNNPKEPQTGVMMVSATSSSGCDVCAQYGDCSHAFHNGPGQYCGHWYGQDLRSYLPCCCPHNTICKVTDSSCRCHVESGGGGGGGGGTSQVHHSSNNYYNPPPATKHYHSYDRIINTFVSVIGGLIIFICCLYFLCGGSRNSYDKRNNEFYGYIPSTSPNAPPAYNPNLPTATAIPVNTNYYGSMGGGGGGTSGGGSGGFGSAAMGAVAGLVTGAALGSAFGHRRNEYGGGDGGYDVAGDSGSGGGGGGFDFAGDSGGGGGFDFAGDSGGGGGDGGGDIAGDF